MVGLDLDDDAADALEQQRRADEIGGDRVHAAGEEIVGGAAWTLASSSVSVCSVVSQDTLFRPSPRGAPRDARVAGTP